MNNSSFLRRIAAYLVDIFILITPITLIKFFMYPESFSSMLFFPFFVELTWKSISVGLVCVFAYWVYFVLFESSKCQATIGKMLLAIKVVDKDGNKPSLVQIINRSAVKSLTVVACSFLFIICFFTKKKQNLHDFAGKTFVVYKDSSRVSGSSDDTVKVLAVIYLLCLASGALLYKSAHKYIAGSYKGVVNSQIMQGGSSWKTVTLPDIGLSLNVEDSAKIEKDKLRTELLSDTDNVISKILCYKSSGFLFVNVQIQYVVFNIDVSPQNIIDWFISKNLFGLKNNEIVETEISNYKAFSIASPDSSKQISRLCVIPKTKNSALIVFAYSYSQKRKELVEKVMDSIEIQEAEVEIK